MKIVYIKHRGELLEVKVSDRDYRRVSKFKWWAHFSPHTGNVYAARQEPPDENGKRKKIYMHRFITNAPQGLFVDHKDRDTLNNMRNNLRICNGTFNAVNRLTTNLTGFRGVYHSGLTRFRARIKDTRPDGTDHLRHLGTFDTAEEAARAYDSAALEKYGEFAFVNFPPEEKEEEEIPWD